MALDLTKKGRAMHKWNDNLLNIKFGNWNMKSECPIMAKKVVLTDQ